MTDPLRTAPSPFEVLGVDRTADDAQINAALKARLGQGGSPAGLVAAHRTLQDPVERVLAAARDYWPEDYGDLAPSPFDDPSVLAAERRWETARSWERGFKARFPDLSAAHSLAVLWYWWAEHVSADALLTGDGVGAPSMDDIWRQTIGYWCMLANAEGFWGDGAAGDGKLAAEARQRIVADLRRRLYAIAAACREAGDGGAAEALERLDVALDVEVKTGALVGALVDLRAGRVCCGPLLLGHLGQLEVVTRQVDGALERSPDSADLKGLREALSPLSHISVLLDQEQAQQALDALGEMPAGERRGAEAKRLRARALELLAAQQHAVGDLETALATWKKALSAATGAKEREKVREHVVTACLQRVHAMPDDKPDPAITLLKKACAIVDDERLRAALAERHFHRGITNFVSTQEKIAEKGATKTAVAALKRGLHDLERAHELGHDRAAEQAEVARRVIAQIGSPEVAALAEKAMSAAKRDQWAAR